jgi:uncharacterized protein YraI
MLKQCRWLPFLLIPLLLAGCARFGPAGPEPITEPTFAPVPTFTPTAVAAAAPTVVPADEATAIRETPPPAEAEPAASPAEDGAPLSALLPTATPAADAPAADAPATDAPAAEASSTITASAEAAAPTGPQLVVSGEIVNVRQGPGTAYPTVGTATTGETFTPTGRNEAGDWWEVCCFADQPGWLYGPLVEVSQGDAVALASAIPPAPTAEPEPEPVAAAPTEPTAEEEPPAAAEAPAEAPAQPEQSGTAGDFNPDAQFQIVGYRVIGYGENNGGLFNNGAQHMIFINVIDANGNGIDGAVVKNAINDNIEIVTGPKGPGRAEFEMFWDPYKLYVASDSSGPVTSQITNQMNTAYPHVPDIIGKLGPPEEEYAICPTPDDRCEPPFFHAHWSYEVVFQKVK